MASNPFREIIQGAILAAAAVLAECPHHVEYNPPRPVGADERDKAAAEAKRRHRCAKRAARQPAQEGEGR